MTTQGRPPSEPTRSGQSGAAAQTPGMTDRVQNTAGRVADTVQETARPVVDKASETAQQVADQAGEQVTSRLDMAKDYAAESLTGVAQALRQTGQHLREDGSQPTLGRYADTGAQQVERFSGYLRQHQATELLSDVETFARRNPTTFAGGAFALGLLAARFFRSSGRRPHAPTTRSGMAYGSPSPAPRPATPPPAPRPRFDASNPPSYASGAPAARNIPASPEWTPPSPGSASSGPGASTPGREAERQTPVPGSQPTTPGTGSPGAAPTPLGTPSPGAGPTTGGTRSPGSAPSTGPGAGSPTRDGGTRTGGTAPGSDRPGSGSQRQV